jgi:hypothetical protein
LTTPQADGNSSNKSFEEAWRQRDVSAVLSMLSSQPKLLNTYAIVRTEDHVKVFRRHFNFFVGLIGSPAISLVLYLIGHNLFVPLADAIGIGYALIAEVVLLSTLAVIFSAAYAAIISLKPFLQSSWDSNVCSSLERNLVASLGNQNSCIRAW